MTPVRGCAFSAGSKSRRKPANTYGTRGAFPAGKAPLVRDRHDGQDGDPAIAQALSRLVDSGQSGCAGHAFSGSQCEMKSESLFPSMLSLLTYMDIIRLGSMMCSPGR